MLTNYSGKPKLMRPKFMLSDLSDTTVWSLTRFRNIITWLEIELRLANTWEILEKILMFANITSTTHSSTLILAIIFAYSRALAAVFANNFANEYSWAPAAVFANISFTLKHTTREYYEHQSAQMSDAREIREHQNFREYLSSVREAKLY